MGDVLYRALGASNHANISRADNDFYATPPAAVEMLLEMERFAPIVWEPACGAGHISKVLEKHGYIVESTDIKYRGFGQREPLDFLTTYRQHFEGDIITNPPYSTAEAFARRAIDTVRTGGKVAMLLKIQFLEGKSREDFSGTSHRKLFIFPDRVSAAQGMGISGARKAGHYALRGTSGKKASPASQQYGGSTDHNPPVGGSLMRPAGRMGLVYRA